MHPGIQAGSIIGFLPQLWLYTPISEISILWYKILNVLNQLGARINLAGKILGGLIEITSLSLTRITMPKRHLACFMQSIT